MNSSLDISQFDYELPPELIAQTPAAERTASRLLRLDPAGQLQDLQFSDLPGLLRPNDLLIFNDTRVIKARLLGSKASGGKVEVLVERIVSDRLALAHIKASKSPKPGTTLLLAQGAFAAQVQGRQGELFELSFPEPVLDLLDRYGATPLPPYITHAAGEQDESRYQTVYAREPGAVAAPTAGLHFDDAMLARLEAMGVGMARVTLHVGAGTFQPVRGTIAEHVMHAERFFVPAETLRKAQAARQAGGRVIAVGTTSVRSMESAAAAQAAANGASQLAPDQPINTDGAGSLLAQAAEDGIHGDTRLFITPGYRYAWIDALITNFHLPQSTLLMLVSAFAGTDPIRRAYAHAVAQRYRFFSYGDAMFLEAPCQARPDQHGDA